jgi:hypothetical protein
MKRIFSKTNGFTYTNKIKPYSIHESPIRTIIGLFVHIRIAILRKNVIPHLLGLDQRKGTRHALGGSTGRSDNTDLFRCYIGTPHIGMSFHLLRRRIGKECSPHASYW